MPAFLKMLTLEGGGEVSLPNTKYHYKEFSLTFLQFQSSGRHCDLSLSTSACNFR
jgi:hypothetical protein